MSSRNSSQGRSNGRARHRGGGGHEYGGNQRSNHGSNENPQHRADSNRSNSGQATSFFVSVCLKDDPILRSGTDAFRFLSSSQGEIAEDILGLLSGASGRKALGMCLNLLNYENAAHLSNLMSLFAKLGGSELSRGLKKGQVLEIYTLIFDQSGFIQALKDAVLSGLIDRDGDLLALSWFLGAVAADNADHRNNPHVNAIRNYLLTNADEASRLILKNIFSVGQGGLTSIGDALYLQPQHNNDFPDDFHKVAIFPTAEEVNTSCSLQTVYRGWLGDSEAHDMQILDRQFRLLREDMVAPLREEVDALLNKKQGADWVLNNPVAVDLALDEKHKAPPHVLVSFELPTLLKKKLDVKQSKAKIADYLKEEGRKVLGVGSVLLFFDHSKNVSLVGVVNVRDELKMAESIIDTGRLMVGVQFDGPSLVFVLSCLQGFSFNEHTRSFATCCMQARTTFFSYEPVLTAIKEMNVIPLREELVAEVPTVHAAARHVEVPASIQNMLATDFSQAHALNMALTRRVSIIQGPPGTGKTFIGVQILRALMTRPDIRILCLCYTNHALDSFLESLLDSRIPSSDIIRLGSVTKMSERVKECCYQEMRGDNFSRSQARAHFDLKERMSKLLQDILDSSDLIARTKRFFDFQDWGLVSSFLMSTTEIESSDQLSRQFEVKSLSGGYERVGKRGQKLRADSYWRMWLNGDVKPVDIPVLPTGVSDLWTLSKQDRKSTSAAWFAVFVEDKAERIQKLTKQYEKFMRQSRDLRDEPKLPQLKNARIVACTTTFAAKQRHLLDSCSFNVVMVEEAAEILESHVLTNISSATEHLIMIGDHLQLRPKLEFYPLRTDSGQNVNFDMSLFERLIHKRYPVTTLDVQHRMRPEISQFLRRTYPSLQDHDNTKRRDPIKGTFSNVAFIDHRELEQADKDGVMAANSSKVNLHEVAMCSKMVKYFLQQGYKAEDVVILTPYLGQLVQLRRAIKADVELNMEVALGDRDEADVEDNGLNSDEDSSTKDGSSALKPTGRIVAQKPKQSVRISTIDNFQGEESKIIIASLVRSNTEGEVGFVSGAERVNVLFSRARDGFFILGNSETFLSSKAGQRVWKPLLEDLNRAGYFLVGFPVRCECHAERQLLQTPNDFVEHAKDGGCGRACAAALPSCPHGHVCSRACHPLRGLTLELCHESMACNVMVAAKCPRGHDVRRRCSASQPELCNESIEHKCPQGHGSKHLCWQNASVDCKVCIRIRKQREAEEKKRRELEEQMEKEGGELQVKHESLKDQLHLKKKEEVELLKKRNLQEENVEMEESMARIEDRLNLLKLPLSKAQMKQKQALIIDSSEDNAQSQPSVPYLSPSFLPKSVGSITSSSKSDDSIFHPKLPSRKLVSSSNDATIDELAPAPPASPVPSRRHLVAPKPGKSASPEKSSNPSFTTFSSVQLTNILTLINEENWFEASNALCALDHRLINLLDHGREFESIDSTLVLLRLLISAKIGDDPVKLVECLVLFKSLYEDDEQWLKPTALLSLSEDSRLPYYLMTASLIYDRSSSFALAEKYAKAFLDLASEFVRSWTKQISDLLSALQCRSTEKVSVNPRATDIITRKWQVVKQRNGGLSPSEAMDSLLTMTGLTSVKESFLGIFNKLALSKEQHMPLDSFNLNTRFDGNPGTGKTTVAQLLSTFLVDIEVLPKGCEIVKRTGSELANGGVSALEKLMEGLKEKGGGVVFVDEAYQLNDTQGHKILDFILCHSEKLKGKFGLIVWVFAGYKKQMDDLFKHNPGLPSRFPYTFNFEDYTDEELSSILDGFLQRGGRDIAPPIKKPEDKEKEAKKEKKARSLSMASNGGGNYQNLYYRNLPDQVDAWGNTWKWDERNYTWEDEYDNITGYGVGSLGTASNPLVSRKDNSKWLFDTNMKDWYQQSDTNKRSPVYPGHPLPVAVAPPVKPFTVDDPKWLRIAIRRLGSLRGSTGFGNARAVRNLFEKAHSRQVARVSSMRDQGRFPNIHRFERDDLLGPKASMIALEACPAWKELLAMEGLQEVKDSLGQLLELIVNNSDREEQEKKPLEVALNRIFLGNPGTGKTTVAKLYARILVDLGLLSKGEVILKSSSDFVGGALGKSEEITRGILEQAKGSVLVIDEAYGLFQETGSNSNEPYREAVINTLVEQIQGVPGEDRAVVMLGYREEMENMLLKCNPGLSRRFQLENAFVFADYDDSALTRILKSAVAKDGLKISEADARFAVSRLAKARAGAHFGNAGAVNNLLSGAKLRLQGRLSSAKRSKTSIDIDLLLKDDFVSADYSDEVMDPEELLQSLVGCEEVRNKLGRMYSIAKKCKARGKDPKELMSYNYIFSGSPGTGKTTVARLMGTMFSRLGLIPSNEVVEVSASDLMTGYLGQTGKKTREIFVKARGKVLFIDEAYQLNPKQGGGYMQEAVDEIVKLLTAEDFKGKMIVILAGYAQDMDEMLKTNQGLQSRFTERIHFDNFTSDKALQLIVSRLQPFGVEDFVSNEDLVELAVKLVSLPAFANGRDIDTFVKKAEMNMQSSDRDEDDVIILEDLQKAFDELHAMKGSDCATQLRPQAISLQPLPASMKATAWKPTVTTSVVSEKAPVTSTQVEELEDEEEEFVVIANQDEADGGSAFLRSLQDLLDERGLNSRSGVERLSKLSLDSIEMTELVQEIARTIQCSEQEAREMLEQWQENQQDVREKMAEQEREVAKAKAAGRKALVPIWRCGVCGQADQPYIACYVQPYIVRYEERDLK